MDMSPYARYFSQYKRMHSVLKFFLFLVVYSLV